MQCEEEDIALPITHLFAKDIKCLTLNIGLPFFIKGWS